MDPKELIELQVSEVDMLQSMFPDEFCVDDPGAISEARSIIESEAAFDEDSSREITFTIKIKIDEPEVSKFVFFSLPQM